VIWVNLVNLFFHAEPMFAIRLNFSHYSPLVCTGNGENGITVKSLEDSSPTHWELGIFCGNLRKLMTSAQIIHPKTVNVNIIWKCSWRAFQWMVVSIHSSNKSVAELGTDLFLFWRHRSIHWWSTVTVTFFWPPETLKFPPLTSLLNTRCQIFGRVYRFWHFGNFWAKFVLIHRWEKSPIGPLTLFKRTVFLKIQKMHLFPEN
jgi:hypothetical protein